MTLWRKLPRPSTPKTFIKVYKIKICWSVRSQLAPICRLTESVASSEFNATTPRSFAIVGPSQSGLHDDVREWLPEEKLQPAVVVLSGGGSENGGGGVNEKNAFQGKLWRRMLSTQPFNF